MTITDHYEPFARGTVSVTMSAVTWRDETRARSFRVDLYFPDAPVSLCSDPMASQRHPVVLFAHGWYGKRSECRLLCTHLASHGYRVVAADFPGTTDIDVARALKQPHYDFARSWHAIAEDRLADIPFLISAAARELGETLPAVGLVGTSLGGWAALMAPSVDPRVRAVVALCPMGGEGPLATHGQPVLGRESTFRWTSPVSVTCVVADRDSWLPLYGQIDLFARLPSRDKRLIVLRRADHLHFVDRVTDSHASFASFTRGLDSVEGARGIPWKAMADLIPDVTRLMAERQAQAIVRGIATLQMDSALRDNGTARSALDDASREFQDRHLDAYTLALKDYDAPEAIA